MARRPRVFAPGVLYPFIVRGNQRQKTFTSGGDYQAYLERLSKVPQTIRFHYLRILSDAEPCASAGGMLRVSSGQIYAGLAAILHPVFQPAAL